MSDRAIIASFDRAAAYYDAVADLQKQVAQKLLGRIDIAAPQTILDIGCGTGHVTQLAAQKWPQAHIAALDAAPAMLREAKKKVPYLQVIQADAANLKLTQKFNLILSSMALHWLPRPREALQQWKEFLTPGGQMHVALPVAGSLQEWSDLCRTANVQDGLWHFPAANFAQGLAASALDKQRVTYASTHNFLQNMKQTGANRPRSGHNPTISLRRLLRQPGTFTASYDILYLCVTD